MVPAVSRPRRREASGMIEDMTACFDGLVDPRVTRRCDHRLIDILVIAVSAVIACAESWEDIELYGRSKLAWLKTFLDLPNGIPSHDTFRRVFMLIDPDAFEGCFTRWAQSLRGKVRVHASNRCDSEDRPTTTRLGLDTGAFLSADEALKL